MIGKYLKLGTVTGTATAGGNAAAVVSSFAGDPGDPGSRIKIGTETMPVGGTGGANTRAGGGGGGPSGIAGDASATAYDGAAGGVDVDMLHTDTEEVGRSLLRVAINWYAINVLSKTPSLTLSFPTIQGAGGASGGAENATPDNGGGGAGGEGGQLVAVTIMLDAATITLNGGNGGNAFNTAGAGAGGATGHCVLVYTELVGIVGITLTAGTPGTGGSGMTSGDVSTKITGKHEAPAPTTPVGGGGSQPIFDYPI